MRKHLPSLVVGAFIIGNALTGQAQTGSQTMPLSPQAQYEVEKKQAAARYKDDQRICNDDPDSASRMQCKRDAKTEYDKAIAAAKTRMGVVGQPAPIQSSCQDCGRVVAVKQTEKKVESSALGMIAGGVAGGVLGHQIGGGTGKTLATVAGAAGGAYAGNEIEKNVKSHKVWTVSVKYPNGATSNFEFAKDPGFKIGDPVKNSDKTIIRP